MLARTMTATYDCKFTGHSKGSKSGKGRKSGHFSILSDHIIFVTVTINGTMLEKFISGVITRWPMID